MRFRAVVLTIFAALYLYLAYSLFLPWESWSLRVLGCLALLALFGVILWVPLVFWRLDAEETTAGQRRLLWIAYGGMGILSFSFVLSGARDVVALLSGSVLHTPAMSLAILGASIGLFALGHLKAQHGVTLKQVTVPLPGLPSALAGFRIVLLSDLHVGPTIRRAFVERVVRLANAAQPDLIAFTGDAVDGTVKDLGPQIEPLRELEAKCGKYYVTGNHEFYWEGPPWIEKMRSLGLVPLINENRLARHGEARFAVAGVTDPAAQLAGMEGPNFAKASAGIPEDVFLRILLCHQPKFSTQAEKAGFTLQLSGHTHGGQFFPWTWVASWVHRFPYGLHRLERLAIYVSRGTGYWGPPVRIGSPAEVTLLVLKPA